MTDTTALLLLVIEGVHYSLRLVPNGFEVQKQGTTAAYTVSVVGAEVRCSCRGWVRYRRCKHCRSLRETGLIRSKEVA